MVTVGKRGSSWGLVKSSGEEDVEKTDVSEADDDRAVFVIGIVGAGAANVLA